LAIAAIASTLSLAVLALSADGLSGGARPGETLVPSLVQLPEAPLPTLPAIFPR
jgi:hypothetical protein